MGYSKVVVFLMVILQIERQDIIGKMHREVLKMQRFLLTLRSKHYQLVAMLAILVYSGEC